MVQHIKGINSNNIHIGAALQVATKSVLWPIRNGGMPNIKGLFGVKMVEFWAQIWTIGEWRTSSQVSSKNISKY